MIPLGGLALVPGETYFLLLDAWVARDGLGSQVGIGVVSNGDGLPFAISVTGRTAESRDEHFAHAWIGSGSDLAYQMTYTPTPVPEPATAPLCALGLVAVGFARRR